MDKVQKPNNTDFITNWSELFRINLLVVSMKRNVWMRIHIYNFFIKSLAWNICSHNSSNDKRYIQNCKFDIRYKFPTSHSSESEIKLRASICLRTTFMSSDKHNQDAISRRRTIRVYNKSENAFVKQRIENYWRVKVSMSSKPT